MAFHTLGVFKLHFHTLKDYIFVDLIWIIVIFETIEISLNPLRVLKMKKVMAALVVFWSVTGCVINPDGSKLNCEDETKLEYYNRAVFNFNYQLDKKVMKPVAKGYKKITNKFVRQRVGNLFDNLEEPVYALNNVLQGEFKNGGISLGRFVVNSTLGLAGTFDVAAGWGWEKKKAGFDGTMAKYCVPDGPFFVMPVLGPSTPRYLVGWGADAAANPTYWALIDVHDDGVDNVIWGAAALKYVNLRAENMEILDSLEEGSVDFYTTMKSAFLQHRQKYGNMCGSNQTDNQTASYDFDFGYDEIDDESNESDLESDADAKTSNNSFDIPMD